MVDKYRNKTVIFVPTLNRSKLLEKTIVNLSKSTEKYDEIYLVIFDNKSDDFPNYGFISDIIKNNDKVSLIKFDERLNAHANWNRCVNLLRNSKYIAFYHDDDLYSIDMPKKQIDFLNENPNVVIACTNSSLIDENDNIIGVWQSESIEPIIKGEDYIKDVLINGRNIINCPSVMLRTNLLPDPLFFENLEPNGGDIVTWLKLALKNDIGFLNEKLMQYRKHMNAETSKTVPIKGIYDTYCAYQYFITENSISSNFIKTNEKYFRSKIRQRYSFQIFKQLIKISVVNKDKAIFLKGCSYLDLIVSKFSFYRFIVKLLKIKLIFK